MRNWKAGSNIPEWTLVGPRCQGIYLLSWQYASMFEGQRVGCVVGHSNGWNEEKTLDIPWKPDKKKTPWREPIAWISRLCLFLNFQTAYFPDMYWQETVIFMISTPSVSQQLHSSHRLLLSPSAAWRPSRRRPPAPSWAARSPASTRRSELSYCWRRRWCCCEPPGTEPTHTCGGETWVIHYYTAESHKVWETVNACFVWSC